MTPPPREHTRRRFLGGGVAVGALAVAGCLDVLDGRGAGTQPDGVAVETVADGFTGPWGLAFVPDSSRLLVTEVDGRLSRLDREDGSVETLDGTPTVDARGQGGLLDVTLHPDYPDEPWVYLTYSAANDAGETTTHLARGRLDPDGTGLREVEVLHAAEPFVDSTAHYGSRVVVGPDEALYVTVGDRQFKDFGPDHVAQDTTTELGAVLRLGLDGSVPEDNPFVADPDVRDSIFSYGHRNPQGLTVHPETGDLWESEHGERDGDELNVLETGGNFGWPIASEACNYGTDDPVAVGHDERDDVVAPVHYWECGSGGFPPAGMTLYDGDAFPDWRGDLFVGTLAGEYLGHFAVDGREVAELDPLLDGRGWRIRDVAVAPDTGHLYAAVDGDDAPVVRLVPE